MNNRNLHPKMTLLSALLFLMLCIAGITKSYAYDFSAVCETGQTLYYNITDAENHYVELTYPGTNTAPWYGYTKPTGDITLPYSVTYNEASYSVVSIGYLAFYYCRDLTGSLIIPNSVTYIESRAFEDCSGFTGSLIIGNAVASIGERAFFGCSGFTGSLTISNSVTTIGESAFGSCSGFTGNLTIGDSVTYIGSKAFDYCSGFTGSLNIGKSVNTIVNLPFYGCSRFEQIIVDTDNTRYDSRENCNAIIETNTNTMVFGCKSSIIPNTITMIGPAAFYGCSGLTGPLTIPNAVTSIGDLAFSGCTGLTGSLNIPNSVTYIGQNAFSLCSSFTGRLTIPNSVATIGNSAFQGCSGFTGLMIPNSVTTIGISAFSGCWGLEYIEVDFGNTVYDSRDNCNAIIETNSNRLITGCKYSIIPNTVTSIGNSAFYGCKSLISIEIPDSVTSIGSYAFFGCWGLEYIEVDFGNTVYDFRDNCNAIIETNSNRLITGCKNSIIPNTVTSIGYDAFYGCSGFTGSMTIPNSVTSIGAYAFAGCSGLEDLVMFGMNPPSLGNYCFTNTDFPIYVPYESLNDYKTANNWSNYEDRIFPMAYTIVSGYGEGEGNYRFIASPLVENTAPTTVDNMITETPYDLYRFDQSEVAEWQNYKSPENTPNFFLTNGQGYLYANSEDMNLVFKGNFNEDETKEVELAYDANADFAGWNLVGNPFPVSAYANKSYYVMNEEGSAIEPVAVSSTTAIEPCMGIMVKADGVGESVTFTKSTRQVESNGLLQIAVAENTRSNTIEDKAVISFNEGDALGKFVFNKDNAQISIPQSGEDYAIACVEKGGEMPLNFKAAKNGSYTLSVNPEAVEMEYLHLVDNLTGNDIDLLVTPSYTFEAKTSDYASRFRLVFSVYEDVDGDNEEPFAFISNGSIIVTGDYDSAMMQIVDLTGRVVVSTEVANNVSVNKMATGVYVLRLINGENVRTQKIVVNN